MGARSVALSLGLVPVAFDFRGRRVRLLDMAGLRGADCREPHFMATAQRWRQERNWAAQVEFDLEAFLRAARCERRRQPAGFIFNIARCGSTLLANMLTVQFPWGSLLRGLLEADPSIVSGIARLLKPGATATLLLSVTSATGPRSAGIRWTRGHSGHWHLGTPRTA